MNRTRDLLVAGLTFGVVVTLQSGCAGTATMTQPTVQPKATSQSTAEPAVASDLRSLSGKVAETMNAGSYTYVNVEKDGQKFWAAVPTTKVSVGQNVEVRSGIIMGKFTSSSLKRTFDDIVFSPGLVTDAKESPSQAPQASSANISLPPGHRPIDSKPQIGQGQSATDAKALPKGHMGMMGKPANGYTAVSGKVMETMDSGGYTYICLESGGKKVWAAVPTTKVSVGQELTLKPGQEMSNFNSKSLNRTFDSVIFSGGVLPATK